MTAGFQPKGRVCFLCGRQLSSDPTKVHFAVDAERMEELGIYDPSELPGDADVIVELCEICGTREQAPSVQELRDKEPKQ